MEEIIMIKKIIAVVAVILVIAMGMVAYSFLKTPEAASEPIEAIPIVIETDEPAAADARTETVTQPEDTEAATEAQTEANSAVEQADNAAEAEAQANTAGEAAPAVEAEPQAETDPAGETDTEMAAAPAEAEAAGQTAEQAATAPIIFEIVPADSEARFLINEVLRGDPTSVVGTTDQVAGQFAVFPNDLSNVQIGTIQVNARTLATDNSFRNRAIKNRILLTDNYEFITFTPTEVTGLPESGAIDETYTFQVAGDLTITDITRPVTFEVTATPINETRIEATASTTILYQDFELAIPRAPAVDAVEDEVRLELEFVAEAI
jgi:polyisoprenoid-binding protein YceI